MPEKPTNAVAIVKGAKSIQVNWTKQTVKPGNTTYMIKAYEILDGTESFVKTISVNGWYIYIQTLSCSWIINMYFMNMN